MILQERVKSVLSELAIDISEREEQSLSNGSENQSPGLNFLKVMFQIDIIIMISK